MAVKKPRRIIPAKLAGRVKKTVMLRADMARMLAIYAASVGRDQSDVVSDALEPVLAGLYLARKTSGEPISPQLADHSEAA